MTGLLSAILSARSHSPPTDGEEDYNDTSGDVEDIDADLPSFEHPLDDTIRLGIVRGSGLFRRNSFSSESSDSSAGSTSSSLVYDLDYEILTDTLLEKQPSLMDSSELKTVETNDQDTIMLKCLPRTSPELYLLLQLNHPEFRDDPWNPAPRILCAVERDDVVFLYFQQLTEFNRPPFQIVGNYIDFVRQALEGITFLHEHDITFLGISTPGQFMVDIGAGPLAQSSVETFDRAVYPVRYYYTHLSGASKANTSEPFRKDVADCGRMFDHLLGKAPRIAPKFRPLVKAMTSGNFGADDARKLFEALCKLLHADVFETRIMPSSGMSIGGFSLPSLARTRSVK